ncbi:MAG: enoyl-CoA hydratase/isomerase family protein [Candidatus Binatia bacterium]
MSDEHILYEARDGIATITFNRPAAMNALLPEMNDRLPALVSRAEADEAVRVIVLTGAGKAFSAGADIKMMGRADRLGRSALVGRARALHGAQVVERLLRREKPMLAAVNGVAAGMACSFVLACDFALAAETARFAFSFAKVGFIPDSGCTYLLPRRIGLANAQRLCLTAEPVAAAEALRLGLVSEVVSGDQLAARASAVAAQIAALSPHAVRTARSLLERGAASDFHQATEAEALAQGVLGETADHQEAVRAFMEKRPPVFTGR